MRAPPSSSGASAAQEQAAAAEQLRLQQSEAARVQREQAHAAHVAGVMHDLHAERARAAAYFESLTTLGTRRSMFEALVTRAACRGAGARE